jgi:hypothetical protein
LKKRFRGYVRLIGSRISWDEVGGLEGVWLRRELVGILRLADPVSVLISAEAVGGSERRHLLIQV